jgi:hypothetical protein
METAEGGYAHAAAGMEPGAGVVQQPSFAGLAAENNEGDHQRVFASWVTRRFLEIGVIWLKMAPGNDIQTVKGDGI